MIELFNISKTYTLRGHKTVVANNITATFPSGVSVGLLGCNGAGKSSMLRMIAGTTRLDSGHIRVAGSVSWPVGFAGSFHPEMTGLQNTRFIARVYGVDTNELCRFVRDFSELEQRFDLPVRSYSSGMRARLAFAVSMGVKFDTYLVDEVTAVGDASFRQKSEALLNERLKGSGAVIVTHALGQIQRLCQHAAVLEGGKLTYYTDVEKAILHHQDLMRCA